MTNSVIVGDAADSHVEAVTRAMRARGSAPSLVVDASKLVAGRYLLTETSLAVDGARVDLNGGGTGWLRRHAPTGWGAGTVTGSLDAVRRRSFLTLIASISRLGNRDWLTGLDAMLAAEDRLHQLQVARRLGLRTPRTVVASCGDDARATLGDRFIVKPLGTGYYHTDDGPRAVFTTMLSERDLGKVDFADAPFIAQELVDTVGHVRVVTVRGRAWVASLEADGRPLDWRAQPEAHEQWVATPNAPVANAALALADALNVGYSSQDWLLDSTSDTPIFIDLNPGGQWLFLPSDVAGPVTDAIARHLIGDKS